MTVQTRMTEMADRIILAMEGFDGDQSSEFLDEVFSKLLPDVHDLLTLLAAASAPAPEATRSQRLAEAGYTRRPSWRSLPKDGDDEPDAAPAQAQQAEAKPLTNEQRHEIRGTGGADVLELAKLWADNKVHTYQVVNEAEKIIDAAVDRALAGIGASTGGKP